MNADTTYARSTSGGYGSFNIGSNYSCSIAPSENAKAHGYQQMLWLAGSDHAVSKIGDMNVFFVIKSKSGGGLEVVTPALGKALFLFLCTCALSLSLTNPNRMMIL